MSKAVYPSKYTDRKVTDAQYLTDEIMERIAKEEKAILPYKYWNNERWKKIFLAQLTHANTLLKEYDSVTIMKFLRSYKGQRIYSLGLRQQILAGCKAGNFAFHPNGILLPRNDMDDFVEGMHPEQIEIEGITDDWLTEEEKNIKEYSSETKSNLWEKLN